MEQKHWKALAIDRELRAARPNTNFKRQHGTAHLVQLERLCAFASESNSNTCGASFG